MGNLEKAKIILIGGPTGIGKTSLSLRMAGEFNGAIVGADSMQIYKYMEIGTAKPSLEERDRVLHYMIDIATPDLFFDAASYAKQARESISQISEQGRIPFVVGGTGFYIKALLYGLCRAKPSDPAIRENLRKEFEIYGGAHMYERLSACDPEAAGRIHPHDTYRVLRALEIYILTGKPMSEFQKEHSFRDIPYDMLKIGLILPREMLYERINFRVDRMIAEGLLDEVKKLLAMGFSEGLRSMNALGYRHMLDYLNGRMPWDEAIRILKRDTRRYAKRQLTWFQKDQDMIWKPPDAVEEIRALIGHFLDS